MSAPDPKAAGVEREAAFDREERYIVIKRKHLTPFMEGAIKNQLSALEIHAVEAIVVEHDWPEYETVWKMIEERASGGASSQIIAVDAPPKGGEPTDEQVREAMQTAWDDFCDDAQARDRWMAVERRGCPRRPEPRPAGYGERAWVVWQRLYQPRSSVWDACGTNTCISLWGISLLA